MVRKYMVLGLLALMLAGAGIVLNFAIAHADNVPTFVVMDPLPPIQAGQPFQVTGGLYRKTDTGQAGIPQRSINLYIEPDNISGGTITKTTLLGKVFSNSEGRIIWTVRERLVAGHYRLYFFYEGSPRYSKANTAIDITVVGSLPAAPSVANAAKKVPEKMLAAVNLGVSMSSEKIVSGEPISIVARLSDKADHALSGQLLRIKLPGITQQRVTSENGVVIFEIKNPLPVGRHSALILFGGAPGYSSAKLTVNLTVNPPVPTSLSLVENQDALYVGVDGMLTARLLTQNNEAVKAELLRYYIDGEFRYGVNTDSEGRALIKVPRTLTAGNHTISVTFRSSGSLVGTERSQSINVLPRPFEIQTVPALPQVKIKIGQQTVETDPQGVARLLVEQGGELPVTVLPYEPSNLAIRAKFERWSDDVFSSTRTINVNNGKAYQIGFALSYPIETLFWAANSDRVIDPKRISDIKLVSNTGEKVQISASGQEWVTANQIIKRESTLESTPVVYYLQSVNAEGVNVVNEGQQKFEAHPNAEWRINLQLHDLKITAYDAIFGFPVGNAVQVVHPNGQTHQTTLDEKSQIRIESLARGSYTVTVAGVMGVRTPLPVSLSQNQDVQAAIITYFDIAVVALILLTVVAVTLFVGRPTLISNMHNSFTRAR